MIWNNYKLYLAITLLAVFQFLSVNIFQFRKFSKCILFKSRKTLWNIIAIWKSARCCACLSIWLLGVVSGRINFTWTAHPSFSIEVSQINNVNGSFLNHFYTFVSLFKIFIIQSFPFIKIFEKCSLFGNSFSVHFSIVFNCTQPSCYVGPVRDY